MSGTGSETRVRVETVGVTGGFWFAGWLFTIGFAKLTVGQAIIAIIGWPYFLGLTLR